MSRINSVMVEAIVHFIVDIDAARAEGETGDARGIALDVVGRSAGAEFDNMVMVHDILSTKVVR